MQLKLVDKLKAEALDARIIGVTENQEIVENSEINLNLLKEKQLFEGKTGESFTATVLKDGSIHHLILLGLGTEESFNLTKVIKTLATLIKEQKKNKVTAIGIDLSMLSEVTEVGNKLQRQLFSGIAMCDYEFNDYKTDSKPSPLETIAILNNDFNAQAFEEAVLLGETNVFSRMLTNMPANIMTPEKLAELAITYAEGAHLEIEIKEQSEIEALGMKSYLAVAKGSSNPPKLIIMRHKGDPDSDKIFGFVGKGLTYDSGGLSIKPTASMVTMKDDMGGASAVIAAMGAISKLGLKVNVVGVVAACENMISGMSYKPGDIIESMGGKTIYIGNTDAEGRLTLIDAVTYVQKIEGATHVVDIATLTGAAIHCLGSEAAPVVTNNEDFYYAVEKAFEKANEKIWLMPVFDEYKELLKHDQADLTNTAGSPGTITAGLFIGEFAKDIPWVHIDIAGTAFKDKAEGIYSKGGTGSGAIPLVYLAKKMSK